MMSRTYRRHAFTLTEILIALALISFLLVGISRIFTMTSSTISAGQSISGSLRTQRAIQQTLSNDILGYSSTGNIDRSDDASGMSPLVVPTGGVGGAPFLIINNFRVATYKDQQSLNASPDQPTNIDTYATASYKTRSIDLNGDGTINPSSTASTTTEGEVIPVFFYGERNFRTDTLSFFGRGDFQSQTGGGTAIVDDIKSNEAWFWYGHLQVFNSDLTRANQESGYGLPGDRMTLGAGSQPNRNNRFASQFLLGRMQSLLIEPQPVETGGSSVPTVLTPAGKPVMFVDRRWTSADDDSAGEGVTPIYFDSPAAGGTSGSEVRIFNGTTNTDVSFATDAVGAAGLNDRTMSYHTRTDVLGTGSLALRDRTRYVQSARPTTWHDHLLVEWKERPWVNPFAGAIAADAPKALARRVPLLGEGCSQFIVEYAGDFIGQANNGTRTSTGPDGVIDFVAIPVPGSTSQYVHQIRWYGMPRDVDGNNVILGNAGTGAPSAAIMQSPDVIYLRDIRGVQSSFEKNTTTGSMPAPAAQYHNVINETSTQDGSRYTCAWGPAEFETSTGMTAAGDPLYDVPQMIRVIVDVIDPKSRTSEPVTQEYVFPVKVKP